jgi:SRSO17 transposase
VPGTSEQRLQAFLTQMPWDEEDLNRQRVQQMIAEATRGEGVLVFDETGFPTPGKGSVGGERQYSGTLGKVGHGQLAVTCGDTDSHATWPVAVRLSLPKTWTDTPERRQQARVPAAVRCQTKAEIALALLEQARAWGVPHRCPVADADDGDTPNVLAGLETRQEPSVVAVRTDFQVRRGSAATSPVWRADEWLHRVPRWQGRTMRWRRGTTGWLRKQCVAGRSWRVTSHSQRSLGWLVGERATHGQAEERQYSWSHRPADTPRAALAGDAHRRHAMEPLHAEATGELGWEQDQGRLWPGVHRPVVTVLLAYRVLVWLERCQQRRSKRSGRTGDPFAPSPGAPPQDAPSRAP